MLRSRLTLRRCVIFASRRPPLLGVRVLYDAKKEPMNLEPDRSAAAQALDELSSAM